MPGVITIQSRLRYARWRTELSGYFAYEGIECNGVHAAPVRRSNRAGFGVNGQRVSAALSALIKGSL